MLFSVVHVKCHYIGSCSLVSCVSLCLQLLDRRNQWTLSDCSNRTLFICESSSSCVQFCHRFTFHRLIAENFSVRLSLFTQNLEIYIFPNLGDFIPLLIGKRDYRTEKKKCFVCLFNNCDMSLLGLEEKKNFVAMLCDAGKQEFVLVCSRSETFNTWFVVFDSCVRPTCQNVWTSRSSGCRHGRGDTDRVKRP